MANGTCPIVVDGTSCTTGLRIVRGTCLFHYRQAHAGIPYKKHKPQRPSGANLIRVNGQKQCARCERFAPESAFTPSVKASDGLQSWCSQCSSDYMTNRRYGMIRADIEALVALQGGCAVCGVPEPRNVGFRNGWHVDHDHSCCPGDRSCGRCVRAVLCAQCNKLLGLANDDPALLEAAIRYLRDCEAKHEREADR